LIEASGSPEVDQGLTRRPLDTKEKKMQSNSIVSRNCGKNNQKSLNCQPVKKLIIQEEQSHQKVKSDSRHNSVREKS